MSEPSPLDDIFSNLPPLPLSVFDTQFKNTGRGVLSGEFPALAKSQLERLADVLVDGGSEQWRLQIAHKSTLMPTTDLFRHIGKLVTSAAACLLYTSPSPRDRS